MHLYNNEPILEQYKSSYKENLCRFLIQNEWFCRHTCLFFLPPKTYWSNKRRKNKIKSIAELEIEMESHCTRTLRHFWWKTNKNILIVNEIQQNWGIYGPRWVIKRISKIFQFSQETLRMILKPETKEISLQSPNN